MKIMEQTMTQTTTQATPRLKQLTPLQEEREARDAAIYDEYSALASVEGQSRTELNKYLMRKYGIHSTGTIYEIIRRQEERRRGRR